MADPPDRSDAALLADTLRPADSFTTFYRRHDAALLRFAASRGLDVHAAADVVAETFAAALQHRHRYKPQGESARLWLLGIAVRKIADHHRDETRHLRRQNRLRDELGALTQADVDSYEQLVAGSDTETIDALSDLPTPQQDAIRARVLEDRDYADVAVALGLSEAAARKQVSRGLAALRSQLGRHR
ncbi:MAG: sigma-70 family RNA polymerase sigma factor [Solirubrobacteraceae bacterium]|nr:sigma-70 family RNA polymerase sigma factor [Patulibacter sp.]